MANVLSGYTLSTLLTKLITQTFFVTRIFHYAKIERKLTLITSNSESWMWRMGASLTKWRIKFPEAIRFRQSKQPRCCQKSILQPEPEEDNLSKYLRSQSKQDQPFWFFYWMVEFIWFYCSKRVHNLFNNALQMALEELCARAWVVKITNCLRW